METDKHQAIGKQKLKLRVSMMDSDRRVAVSATAILRSGAGFSLFFRSSALSMMGSPSDYLSSSLADLPRPACSKSFKNMPPENEQRINYPQFYGHIVPLTPDSSSIATHPADVSLGNRKEWNQRLRKRVGISSRKQWWYRCGLAKQTLCNGTVSGQGNSEPQVIVKFFKAVKPRAVQPNQRIHQHGSQTKLQLPNISTLSIAPRKKSSATATVKPSVAAAAQRTTPSDAATSRLSSYGRKEAAFNGERHEYSEDVPSEVLRQFGVEGILNEREQAGSRSHFGQNSDGNLPLAQIACQSASPESQTVDSSSIEASQSEVPQYLIPWLTDSVSLVIKYRLNMLLLRDAIFQPSEEDKEKFESCPPPQDVKRYPPI
ncbi:hypothetical protein TTRE_0000061801 [Trichuris trichiura]|uniref:Uncharacterized protein n=1 Tax=Trichuris trichiura TaxID=36087 RepID=A0A077YX66_TRITR|nr:hypothetical protein TTRE_0000061801 [Trichuris trichiura]